MGALVRREKRVITSFDRIPVKLLILIGLWISLQAGGRISPSLPPATLGSGEKYNIIHMLIDEPAPLGALPGKWLQYSPLRCRQ
jgi:hypothetical protein